MKDWRTSTFSLGISGTVLTAMVGACVPVVRVKLADRSLPRASLCPEAVVVFTSPEEVGKQYVEVAQLSTAPPGGDFVPSREQVHRAERKKAGQLGANGIILRQALGGRELLYDDAVAIFIPEDSAGAAKLCAGRGRTA